MSDQLPLFPLRSVLLPGGRMSLQIFEPRYVDLVGRSMKDDSGFGILRIVEGHEVVIAQGGTAPRIAPVGTLARIVDWDAMPQGRLRITVEGSRRFRLISSHTQPDHLLIGEVEWLPDAESRELAEEYAHLGEIMTGLAEHPALRRLGVSAEGLDSRSLAYLLAQYLPLDEDDRFAVLVEDDPLTGLAYLNRIVSELAGERS